MMAATAMNIRSTTITRSRHKGRKKALSIAQKKRAIMALDKAMEIGGIKTDAEGARILKVRPENFSVWRRLRTPIGPTHVETIFQWGQGKIKRSDIRPDIFKD
jgi:DNA-binding transcriptional regulator YdaS (Cro superfamily)